MKYIKHCLGLKGFIRNHKNCHFTSYKNMHFSWTLWANSENLRASNIFFSFFVSFCFYSGDFVKFSKSAKHPLIYRTFDGALRLVSIISKLSFHEVATLVKFPPMDKIIFFSCLDRNALCAFFDISELSIFKVLASLKNTYHKKFIFCGIWGTEFSFSSNSLRMFSDLGSIVFAWLLYFYL